MKSLKPCPHCGNTHIYVGTVAECRGTTEDDEYNYGWDSTHYDCVCDAHNGGCGASVNGNYTTAEEAVNAWNRRAKKKGKQLVIVAQGCNKYLFYTTEDVKAGDHLLLKTINGNQHGIAVCDSFAVDAEVYTSTMKAFGTHEERMQPVLGRVHYELFKEEETVMAGA